MRNLMIIAGFMYGIGLILIPCAFIPVKGKAANKMWIGLFRGEPADPGETRARASIFFTIHLPRLLACGLLMVGVGLLIQGTLKLLE